MELREKKILADKIINLVIDELTNEPDVENAWDTVEYQEEIKEEIRKKVMLLLPNGKDK